jgi:NitT/TauT family transport system ATP-binding protein
MIEVEAASKVYVTATREIWAVRDISLSVGGGEFVSIVGPSGCGKSTLLNMIAGFGALATLAGLALVTLIRRAERRLLRWAPEFR